MAEKEKKNTPTTRTPTKQMRLRALLSALVILVLFFGADILSLAKLQLLETDDWQKRAVSQQLSDTVVSAKRGTIYDASMQPLAESADVWKIIMSPKNISSLNWKKLSGVDTTLELSEEQALETERRFIAKGLAELFELDEEKLYEKTGKTASQYEVIKSKVEYNVKTAFSEWVSQNGLDGAFYIISDYKRYYPQGTLASTVLGFTGTDNTGLEGLEHQYDSLLSGTAGRIVTAQNALGDEMPTTMEYTKVVDAKDGNGLVLTINPMVQMYTEKYLGEAVQSTGCTNRGVAIVMDVNTGGILGMATKGDYDPNDPFTITDGKANEAVAALSGDEQNEAYYKALQMQWKNKAINDPYEPGSVFKVYTTAMGLEENILTENTTMNCTGAYKVGGWNIHCHVHSGHGMQNLAQAISNSCNPWFMQAGLKIGARLFYQYFVGFGFTELTGIDMSGEAGNDGLYHSETQLDTYDASLATAAFGQTFKITPIQMITAMSAIANGGKLMTPYVVSQILDGEGNVVSTTEPKVKRQIISASTSATICKILGEAVNGGGSKNAYVAGYRVGGKTGTSEKRDILDRDEVVASFAGFAPVDDPKVAILVLLDEPHSPVRYGGTISAPVAQKIFTAILPILGVEPSYTDSELAKLSRTAPETVGMLLSTAEAKITAAGLKASVVGKGEKVLRQMPAAGETVPAGGTVLLYTENEQNETVKTPNFVGKSVTEVNQLAASVGLNVQLQGLVVGASSAAIASAQNVSPGTEVAKGTVVRVTFLYNDTNDGTGFG